MNTLANRTLTAIAMAVMAVAAHGGSLDSPAAPSSPGSAMPTLDNIWNKLNDRSTTATKRTGAFVEPTAGPGATGYTLEQVMLLVTNRAPVARTGQTTVFAAGQDDGSRRMGVAWPNPRFSAVATSGPATNQIRDNLTGLIWAKNANLAKGLTMPTWSSVTGTCTWYRAVDAITNPAGPVNGAMYGGTNDWRLPNIAELHSLQHLSISYSPIIPDTTGTQQWSEARGPFTGIALAKECYWSSTQLGNIPAQCWTINSGTGYPLLGNDRSAPGSKVYVWPVRGGGN